MSNIAVIPQINLPPALLQQFAAFNGADDLAAGVSAGFPVISIRGAKWRIVEGGEENPIYMPGTKDLAPAVKVVLLRSNPNLSKTFYEGQYVEGSDAKPDCYSNDGVAPAADAPKPQCSNCAQCPQNAWGSKISPSGSKIKACADVRRMAVLPVEDLGYSPCLLRVPGASLSDLAAYGRALSKRGIPYAAVVTKLSFDPDAAYPKIMFQFERVLGQGELATVAERINDPVVDDVLGLNEARSAAPAQAAATEDDKFGIPADVQAPAAPAAQAQEPAAQAEPAAESKPKATRSRKSAGFGGTAEPAAQAAQAQPEPDAQPDVTGASTMEADLEAALGALGMN